MKLIAETDATGQLAPVLNNIKNWNIQLDSIEWVDDIKSKPFKIYRDVLNGQERRVIEPLEENTIFVYLNKKHPDDTLNFAGATFQDRTKNTEKDKISIIISGNESQEVLELRFVHEYLHAMELQADELEKYASDFLPKWMHWFYLFLKWRKMNPEHMPFFQRRYYHWLLDRRENGAM